LLGHAKVDFSYQLTHDRDMKTFKPTNRFGYVNIINYSLTIAREINCSYFGSFREGVEVIKG